MNVLLISSNFLNKKSPAYYIERDLVTNLFEKEINITVLSCDYNNLSSEICPYKVLKVKGNRLVTYLFAIMRKIFPDLSWLPDSTYYSWGLKASLIAKEYIKKQKIDTIISIGFPNACHWLTYQLKRKYKFKWIAVFFDSWVDYPSRIFKTKLFKNLDYDMEMQIAKYADIIVHNNLNITNIWKTRYGFIVKDKIKVIPLNIDFSYESSTPLLKTNKDVVKIAHIGSFYPYRNARPIINSINEFLKEYPECRKKIQIFFIGKTIQEDILLIKNYGLEDIFDLIGVISPNECLEYYQNSDLFISTAGELGEDVMFPSKIIKYFYYNRPILGLTPKGTVTELELRNAGHETFDLEDYKNISRYLYKVIHHYSSVCDFDHKYFLKFNNDTVVNQYIDIINSNNI